MILINPPPRDGKCYQCGEVKPLRKTFRNNNGCVGASWECEDCIVLVKRRDR